MDKTILRYSQAFKLKIVNEIESGKLTISRAQRIYDIKGSETIQSWIKRMGKLHLLNKVVRIEMKDEADKVKALEKDKAKLESALAQAHLRIMALENMLDLASKEYGEDIKKKYTISA